MSGWRSLICTEYDEFSMKNGLLLMRKGEKETTIPIDQLRDLMIVAAASTISVPLLIALTEANANVILCDRRYRPVAQVCGLNQNTSAAGKLMKQIAWTPEAKQIVWGYIVRSKISTQHQLMLKKDAADSLLL